MNNSSRHTLPPRILPARLWIVLGLFASTGCEVSVGDGGFDGDIFDDSGTRARDGATNEDDAGSTDGNDSGSPIDSGSSTDAATPMDAGPTEPMLKPSDVPAILAAGVCGALKACTGEQLLRASLEGNDCVEYTTRQLADRHLHWLSDSVTAGRAIFRSEQLMSCQRDLIALGCDVTKRRLPPSCEQAVEGKRALDETCSIDQDCKGNAYCAKGMQETCPGYCAELQSAGLPCEMSYQCAEGLICRGRVCQDPPSEGDACTARLGNECLPGLVCQGATSTTLTCRSIESVYTGREGESCDGVGKLCEFGLVCASQTSSNTTGFCAARAGAGAVCRAAVPSQCPDTQYCKDKRANVSMRAAPGVDGVCSPRPAEGEGCDEVDCRPGARCVDDPAVCRALKTAGGACVSDAQCYGGDCSPDVGVCLVTTPMCLL